MARERSLTTVRARAILHGEPCRWLEDGTVRVAALNDGDDTLTRYNEVLAADDIRALGTRGMLRPAPFEQLSHERALHASLAVGYAVPSRHERYQVEQDMEAAWRDASQRGNFDAVPDEVLLPRIVKSQRSAALAFIGAGIQFDTFHKQALGFMSVHHNEVVHAMFEREIGETTYRLDYRGIGGLLTSLLQHIPAGVLSFEVLADAVEAALQERYGADRFFDMLKSGALGMSNAKAFRFITLASPLVGEDTAEDSP